MKGAMAPRGWIARTDLDGKHWEIVATGESTLIDSTVSVDVTENASRFVDSADGCVEVRLTFTKSGFARGLRVLIDQLQWKIVNP